MKIITVNKIMCSHYVDEIEAIKKYPFIATGRAKVAVDQGCVLLGQNSAKCETVNHVIHDEIKALTRGINDKIPDHYPGVHST